MHNVRTNGRIIASQVRLIDKDGNNVGQISKFKALDLAKQDGLDLVEVGPGVIPVCKILDYGKYCYNKSKQERHHKHAPVLKEIWMKYNTGVHDIGIKTKKIKEFLETGHKVLFGMKLTGREKSMVGTKERFYEIVKELSPDVKLSDINENSGTITITLHP